MSARSERTRSRHSIKLVSRALVISAAIAASRASISSMIRSVPECSPSSARERDAPPSHPTRGGAIAAETRSPYSAGFSHSGVSVAVAPRRGADSTNRVAAFPHSTSGTPSSRSPKVCDRHFPPRTAAADVSGSDDVRSWSSSSSAASRSSEAFARRSASGPACQAPE